MSKYPEMICEAVDGGWRFMCPACKCWHTHSPGPGHRAAHCHTKAGRQAFPSGYMLVLGPKSTNRTKNWLAAARITDDPAGDLIADMRREADIPEFANIEEMRGYLRTKRACREALAAVPTAWRRYESWSGQQAGRLTPQRTQPTTADFTKRR